MAITELHEFLGRGVVSRVVFHTANQAGSKELELTDVRSLADIEKAVSNSGNWRITRLDLSCDFAMKRHDDEVFKRVHARFAQGVRDAEPKSGIRRAVEVRGSGNKTLRATIELTGFKVPGELQELDGWRSFRFESLRTSFQFQALGAPTVDEELHERLRHALRNLTKSFRTGRT